MVLEPRWKKVLADLWSNKVRTLLVVLSIFIGVFAVGVVAGSYAILSRELREGYLRTNPAHATIATGSTFTYGADYSLEFRPSNERGFTNDLVEVVRHMDQVAEAEGRRNFYARVKIGERWHSLQLIALDDYEAIRINKIRLEQGGEDAWPPPEETVLIERSGMEGLVSLQADVGDTILIERPDGEHRRLRVSGVVHDINQWPTPFLRTYYGYVTRDTLVALGEPYTFNELLIRVKGEGAGGVVTKSHADEVAEQVYEKVQKSGRDPSFPRVATPGQHPLHFLITAIITIMGIMGVFSLFLSGFLVTNTISALLSQQIRQIGMMKAVGARTTQIMTIYVVLVLCFGLLALAPAIPLARFASLSFAGFLATFLNFDLANASIPVYVVAVQATISLVIPMVAALVPIRSGTRMTIREALASEGVATSYGTGFLDRVIQRVRGLPRPLLLSLRNTFRRKGRVFLTLVTLTLGGAFFISVFGVRSALQLTINELVEALYNYDADVYLDRTYRANHVEDEALEVPGVVAAECSAMARVRRVLPDDRESLIISLYAVPTETRTMNPQIVVGRWLLPEDENALVLSTGVLKEDPDIQVGDDMLLKLEDRETTWRVVGLMKAMGEVRWAYASFDYYTRIAHQPGQSSYLRVVTRHHTGEFQAQVATALEEHFKQVNIDVNSTKTIMELSQGDKEVIEVVTVSLMFMAILVAAVGALGLAGTMSLNVIERVREIGIMRSIGASDVTVLQIFMVEGIVIGVISWILGASLAVPLGQALSTTMGQMLFSSPLTFDVPVDGMVVWLVLSLVLAAVASFFPAWRATRVTVRDVLSYE